MKPPFNEVPSYWWDMQDSDNQDFIIVESNDDRFRIVGAFEYKDNAEAAIAEADALIADLTAGRKDPRKCFSALKQCESPSIRKLLTQQGLL